MKTLIQIGTCNGNDDFQILCESQNEKCLIILVEPNNLLNENIRKNYSNLYEKHEIHIVNKAIVDKEDIEKVELYLNEDIGLEVMSSLIHRKTYELRTSKIVESITINNLIKSFDITTIDELHIDAEGMDYNIMLSLDIINTNVKLITCEIWPYNDDDKNIRFMTGPKLLEQIFTKFANYSVTQIILGGMPSLKFTKN